MSYITSLYSDIFLALGPFIYVKVVFQLNPATLRNWPEFLKNNFETLPKNDIPDFFLSPCPVEFVDYFDDPTENEAEEEDEDDRPETGGHFDQFLWQHCHSADIHLQFTVKPSPNVTTTQDYPFTSSVCMSVTLMIPPRDFEIGLFTALLDTKNDFNVDFVIFNLQVQT